MRNRNRLGRSFRCSLRWSGALASAGARSLPTHSTRDISGDKPQGLLKVEILNLRQKIVGDMDVIVRGCRRACRVRCRAGMRFILFKNKEYWEQD